MPTIVAMLGAVGVVVSFVLSGTAPSPATRVFEGQLDSLVTAIDALAADVAGGRSVLAQQAFRRARTAYKRAEDLLAFYAPDAVVSLEGPLETEGDEVSPRPYNTPGMFPLVESAIFPQLADTGRATVLARIHAMRERVSVFRSLMDGLDVEQVAVFDAARVEIARVSTLDIAGFDSDRQDDALLDAAAALDGIRETLVQPAGAESDTAARSYQKADSALRAAANYLRANSTFERMDRLTFLSEYSLPASHAVAALRSARAVIATSRIRLWRDAAASVYDSDAFDPVAYAPRRLYAVSRRGELVQLGARLFTEPRLSGPAARSCAGCHVPTRGFTDGLPKRVPLSPAAAPLSSAPPARHTPTLLNAALQPALFDDERARGLEEQIVTVLANRDEMQSSIDTAVRRVAADSSYRAAFAKAYGVPADRAVTPASLALALASYVRSLTAINSPFDRAVRGDRSALGAAARRGFTVFMAKGRCGTCHFAPLFNGTQPPSFSTSDPEIIGVPDRPVLQHARLDPDPGRGAIDAVESHRFAFKVPTVRNAIVTGPYMHNGAFRSLDDVIAFYNAGGAAGIGINLPYQTLFDQPLGLTRREQTDLIAFLNSLTDTSTQGSLTRLATLH